MSDKEKLFDTISAKIDLETDPEVDYPLEGIQSSFENDNINRVREELKGRIEAHKMAIGDIEEVLELLDKYEKD